MNYITVKNYIEDKCASIKSQIDDLLNFLPSHLEDDIQKEITINSYKHQIDTLTNELNKFKTNQHDVLLINTEQHYSPHHHSQNDNDFNEGELIIKAQTPKKLISFDNEKRSINLFSTLYSFSPLLLSDGRIATPSEAYNKSILILSFHCEFKKWSKDILKEKAHNKCIRSFVELSNNRLVSCSDDMTIKVWSIQPKDLTQITQLNHHKGEIYRIIALSNNRFASASEDKMVKIYNTEYPYEHVRSLSHTQPVWNLLFINSKDMLITSYKGGLVFWNAQTYEQMHQFETIYTYSCITSMIELPSNRIALVTYEPTGMIIFDLNDYSIIKGIMDEEYIPYYSSLCLLDDELSFVYIYNEKVVQISTIDYAVLYKSKNTKKLEGFNGIIVMDNGNYLFIANTAFGYSIVTPIYDNN